MCVYDQNYALVIVIQPKKVGIRNLFRQEDLAFIYHSILQNYFCWGLVLDPIKQQKNEAIKPTEHCAAQ